ncbi:MAG TPA: type VI secretion system tube protein TssD [Chitinophagales bacterium]|nr:type VI secretion system tube protein TssD [Chitinophagales bacterium]
MSSFKAILTLSGKEFRLLSCDFSLSRNTDSIGRPTSVWNGGTINMSVEATDDSSLMEWCVKQADQKDGEIAFQKIDGESSMIKLSWKHGYIINYNVSYSEGGSMYITFTVSAQELTYGKGTHKNPWPKGAGA